MRFNEREKIERLRVRGEQLGIGDVVMHNNGKNAPKMLERLEILTIGERDPLHKMRLATVRDADGKVREQKFGASSVSPLYNVVAGPKMERANQIPKLATKVGGSHIWEG